MSFFHSISQWIKRNGWVSAAIIMILLAGIAYLPNMSKLGIYRDDWHIIFGGRFNGPRDFINLFSIDRPFVGLNFYIFYRFLGERILYWNITALLLRITGGLFFLALIRRLWPAQSLAGLIMGALFIVFPGFMQQSNAITYTMHLTYTLMLIFSLLTMVIAIQIESPIKRILFTLLSLFSMAYYFLLYEYVIGIEGLRLALLVYLVLKNKKEAPFVDQVKLVIKSYWPYLLTAAGLLVWRVFFFHSERPTTDINRLLDQYSSAPIYHIINIAITTLVDFWEITFAAWFVPFYKLARSVSLSQMILSLFIGLLAAGIVFLAIKAFSPKTNSSTNETNEEPDWARHAIWIGAFGLATSILAVVAAGRDIQYESILNVVYDRYTLHATPSAILLLGGLLFTVFNQKWRKIWVVVMVGLAVATQVNAAAIFADAWETTRQFWWQLSWRAPQLEPGTMLLAGFTDDTVILEEYQISYPGTLIYYPDARGPMISSSPLVTSVGEKVVMGTKETAYRRNVEYTNDYSNTLIAYFPTTTSCLHVIDGRVPIYSAGSSPFTEWLAPFSSLNRIDAWADDHVPPQEIFGPKPELTWCYYYQKASLAAQREDWAQVNQYADEAKQKRLTPTDPSEWMPFLLAHVNSKEYEAAQEEISKIKDNGYIRYQVCKDLDENVDSPFAASPEARTFLLEELCTW